MHNNEQELYHFGVKGMRWGHRKVRGHAGPGKYATRKRQLEGDKRDLQTLNNDGHLSVGLTKKRQAAYDKRDKAVLEKRIAKNEAELDNKKPSNKKPRLTKTEKNALKVGGVLAGVSAVQTAGNYINAQAALDAMGYGDRIPISEVVRKGSVQAGKIAVIGAIGYIGAKKVSDLYSQQRRKDLNDN